MSTLLISLDLKKIRQDWLFEGKMGGKFADLIMFENDQPDKYGYTHAIKQNPPKVDRDAGMKGIYVGNAKPLQRRQDASPRPQGQPSGQVRRAGEANASMTRTQAAATQSQDDDSSDIPF